MNQKKLFRLFALLVLSGFQFYFTGCDEVDDIINPDQTESVGDTLWIHHLPQGDVAHYIAGPLAIGTDGTIYYEAGGHGDNGTNWDPVQIYAVNKSDGSFKWKSEPLMTWHKNGETILVGDNGNIYVTSAYKLYSIDPSNGSFNWVWEVPEQLTDINGNPVYSYGELGYMALTNNNDVVIKTMGAGSYQRAYYCISPDGSVKWIQFNVSSSNQRMSIGYDGMIYDVTTIDNLYVLTSRNPDNGELNWTLPVQENTSGNNITFASNGDIITFIHTDTLARINPANHQFVWKTPAGTSHDYKFIAPNGNIYLYDQWAGWYIYNSSNGSMVNSGLSISSQAVSFDEKSQIYGTINDYEAIMHVTDKEGNEIWKTLMGIDGGTVAVSDNVVYFRASDNGQESIFALKTDAGLAHSGWPRFSHDNRNTYNYNKW